MQSSISPLNNRRFMYRPIRATIYTIYQNAHYKSQVRNMFNANMRSSPITRCKFSLTIII